MCLQKKGRGQALLDRVYQHLELIERDYFSLQFCDTENDGQVMVSERAPSLDWH